MKLKGTVLSMAVLMLSLHARLESLRRLLLGAILGRLARICPREDPQSTIDSLCLRESQGA